MCSESFGALGWDVAEIHHIQLCRLWAQALAQVYAVVAFIIGMACTGVRDHL